MVVVVVVVDPRNLDLKFPQIYTVQRVLTRREIAICTVTSRENIPYIRTEEDDFSIELISSLEKRFLMPILV